jgi:phosphoribosyl 1,2-cyclic phosphodiesterase
MAIIKFWGVRGSIPTPGPTSVRYGGNTSCIELSHEGKLFILDAGSGLRALGNELMKRKQPIHAAILISHMHWDHIQGIPFFTPAFIPGNKFIFYGAEESDIKLESIIAGQMDPTYFPIEMKDMASKLEFHRLVEGRRQIDDLLIETIYVNHPGNALGYKIHAGEKTLTYISDNEPFIDYSSENKNKYIGEDGNRKLIDFIKGSHILIHDSQYTPEEYITHTTWGHSPFDYAVRLGLEAAVETLVLFHHDPLHSDDHIDEILERAKQLAAKANSGMKVIAAAEGMSVEV